MDITEALRIVKALYDGVDPFTGEIYESDSPYQNPNIVRALGAALGALERQDSAQKRQAVLPEKAGKPWADEEDAALLRAYDAGATVKQLAKEHERSTGSIHTRLVRLGRIPAVGNKNAT